MILPPFPLSADDLSPIEGMIQDAHSLAEAINDLTKDGDPALAVLLLTTLNAYLEHVQRQIMKLTGTQPFTSDLRSNE